MERVRASIERIDTFARGQNGYKLLSAALLLFVALSGSFVILRVPYTEIDWIAYMQEVRGFLDGERNYVKLRGDTGPLVYPAGFVYIYSFLFYATDAGRNIELAQWIFLGVLLCTVAVVLAIYRLVLLQHQTSKPLVSARSVPALCIVLLVLSRRVMSLHVLRLFNDCVEALFAYGSIWLFAQNKWLVGCALYSLAVSIKMNALLYAPALLMLLLQASGVIKTIGYLTICAAIQVAVGFPFLNAYPLEYVTKAFELSRVFEHKWSVNYAFLSEEVFTSKAFAVMLLISHLGSLVWFFRSGVSRADLRISRENGKVTMLDPDYVVHSLFTCNLIGVTFARTVHYQFYSWYFHTLPYLAWRGSRLPLAVKLAVVVAIELVYNVYPPRAWSSVLLHFSHAVILLDLAITESPAKERAD